MGKFNVGNVSRGVNQATHGCNCRSHEFVFQKAYSHDRKYSDPDVSGEVSALMAPTRYTGWSRDDMDMVCKSVFIGPRVGQVVRMYYSTPKLGVGTQLFLSKELHTNDKMHIDSTGTEGLSLYSWIFSESTNKFYKISGRKIVEVSEICMPEPCNCEEGKMVPHEFFFKRLHRPYDVYRGWTTRDLGELCEATTAGDRIGFPQTLYYSTPALGLGTVLFSAEVPQIEEPGVFTTVGTIRHIDLEGGFWGIMTPNGGLVGDIPLDVQEEGKRVMVTYKISDTDISVSMWGTVIDILDISDVDETDETKFKIKWDNQWIYSAINQMFCRIDDRTIVEMRECSEAPVDCICTEEYSPVCGVDKNTYSNACMAGCAGVGVKHQGECKKPVDDCICTKEYMPVCGTNGQTYGNQCMAECAGTAIAHTGRCMISLNPPANPPSDPPSDNYIDLVYEDAIFVTLALWEIGEEGVEVDWAGGRTYTSEDAGIWQWDVRDNSITKLHSSYQPNEVSTDAERPKLDIFSSLPGHNQHPMGGSHGGGSSWEPWSGTIRITGELKALGDANVYQPDLVSAKVYGMSSLLRAYYMFQGPPVTTYHTSGGLTSVDLSNFDTSNIEDMQGMFYGCNRLETLDLSSFDTGNVTSMHSMFTYCFALSSLDVTHFNTEKVSDVRYMFYGCSSLNSLDLKDFITSNVSGDNIHRIVSGCSNLVSLDVSGWDTSGITRMDSLFQYLEKLTSLDLTSWDVSNVINMNNMFFQCKSLESIDFPTTFDVTNTGTGDKRSVDDMLDTGMYAMFQGCESLTNSGIDFSGWCVPHLSEAPTWFADDALFTERPVWGECATPTP